MDNVQASVVVLRKLSEEWRMQSIKLSSLDRLKETLKSFRDKVTLNLYLSLKLVDEIFRFHET